MNIFTRSYSITWWCTCRQYHSFHWYLKQIEKVRVCINGAPADVHADIKGRDGVYVTLGTGGVYASSTKSKINTVSSTETEVISVGQKLPKNLWFRKYVVEYKVIPHHMSMIYTNTRRVPYWQDQTEGDQSWILSPWRYDHWSLRQAPKGCLFLKFRNVMFGIIEEDIALYKENYKQALISFGLTESWGLY